MRIVIHETIGGYFKNFNVRLLNERGEVVSAWWCPTLAKALQAAGRLGEYPVSFERSP